MSAEARALADIMASEADVIRNHLFDRSFELLVADHLDEAAAALLAALDRETLARALFEEAGGDADSWPMLLGKDVYRYRADRLLARLNEGRDK